MADADAAGRPVLLADEIADYPPGLLAARLAASVAAVRRVTRGLPRGSRRVFVLYFVGNLTMIEIGGRLGLSESASRESSAAEFELPEKVRSQERIIEELSG